MSHIERVKAERNELSDKIKALQAFIYTEGGTFDSLDKDEQVRLSQQLALMRGYLAILDDRLCAAYAK